MCNRVPPLMCLVLCGGGESTDGALDGDSLPGKRAEAFLQSRSPHDHIRKLLPHSLNHEEEHSQVCRILSFCAIKIKATC